MGIIVDPPTDKQDADEAIEHPDLPEMIDDEDIVDYICRVGDWLSASPPPAPPGFVLVACEADPRCHPEYRIAEDVFYPAPCTSCQNAANYRSEREQTCRLEHRKWKSWAGLSKINRRLYALGIIAGSGTSFGCCEFCGIGRQEMRPRWRGGRPYVLGLKREEWACLRRGHRHSPHVACGLCSVCMPCPDCGSIDPTHYSCEVRPGGDA